MGREQEIKLNGQTYWCIKDACQAVGMSVTSVYEYRRKNHCSTQEAVEGAYAKMQTPSEGYKAFGKKYDNIAQACRDYNVSGDMVRSYMRDKGMTLEQALMAAKDSTAFNNKCIERGINPYTARNFVRNYGVSKDEAIESLSLAASSKG